NAGILYHEYGHHITCHTADFRANVLRSPRRQNNRKPAIDEGTCDYWAATVLGTPHIWYWHRRHDGEEVHPRSLLSSVTMADYDSSRGADPHANGTIWAAALWDLRCRLSASAGEALGARAADLLVLKTLLLLGSKVLPQGEEDIKAIRRYRAAYETGLAALLE